MVQGAHFCQRHSRIGVRPAHSCVHLQTAPAPEYVCCRSFYDIQTDREGRLLTSCLPACALQGHFQVVFSRKHCPLFQWRLGFFMRVRPQLYSNMHACPALQLFGRQRTNPASTGTGCSPNPYLMHTELQPPNFACVLMMLSPVCTDPVLLGRVVLPGGVHCHANIHPGALSPCPDPNLCPAFMPATALDNSNGN
jgi:hypothetical protein